MEWIARACLHPAQGPAKWGTRAWAAQRERGVDSSFLWSSYCRGEGWAPFPSVAPLFLRIISALLPS